MASLKRRPGTRNWYIAYRENSQQKALSTETSNRRTAQKILDHFNAGIATAKFAPKKRLDCTPAEFWVLYSDWARYNKAPGTLGLEKIHWEQFLAEFAPKKLGDVTAAHVEKQKLSWARTNSKSPITRNNFLKRMRMFYNWAKGKHPKARITPIYTGENPFADIAPLPEPDNEKRFLNPEQRRLLLKAAKDEGRDIFLFVSLGLHAGLRKREIIYARWDWIDWEQKTLAVRAGDGFKPKSGKSRVLPLSKKLQSILRPYKEDSGYIVRPTQASKGLYRYDPKKTFRKVAKQAGVEWATPHTLRHTFASMHAIAGVSLYKIARWLGDTLQIVVKVYAHLDKHDEDINRA